MTTQERLTFLRKQQGLTQRELAERAHMNYKTLNNYERGYRRAQDMPLGSAQRLASALGVSLAVLAGEAPLPD